MVGYATRIKRDIARWVDAGFIDGETARTLSSDIDSNRRGVSFGAVLTIMAAALFAAAILLIVAANWEVIPRLVRVAVLFAAIFGFYVGGALLKLRGRDNFAEAAWVLAATSFGASIALIGQMYHLSGDEKQAILVWCAGTAFAAAVLRSNQLTVGAALLAIAWLLMWTFDSWRWMSDTTLAYLALAAALYALSFWTRSAAARHVLVLSLSLFAMIHYIGHEDFNGPLLLLVFAVALFAYGCARPAEARRITGLGWGVSVQALIAFLSAIGIMQLALIDENGFLFVTIIAFAGIIAVLLLEGRENGALRWLAYAAFIFQLMIVYIVMFGSMLDTAGFFIAGGLVLSALAWGIGRLERRFSGPDGTATAEGGQS